VPASACGVFDISHDGVLTSRRWGEEPLATARTTRTTIARPPAKALYTVPAQRAGGIVEDLIHALRPGRPDGPACPVDTLAGGDLCACAAADNRWLRASAETEGCADQRSQGAKGCCSPCRARRRRPCWEALVGEASQALPRFGHRSLRLAGHAPAGAGGRGQPWFVWPATGLTPAGRLRTACWNALGGPLLATTALESGVIPLRGACARRHPCALSRMATSTARTWTPPPTPWEASLGWLVHLEMHNFIRPAAPGRQTAEGVSRSAWWGHSSRPGRSPPWLSVLLGEPWWASITSSVPGHRTAGEAICPWPALPAEGGQAGTELQVEHSRPAPTALVVKRPSIGGP